MGVLPIRSVTDSAMPLGRGRGGRSGSAASAAAAVAATASNGVDDDFDGDDDDGCRVGASPCAALRLGEAMPLFLGAPWRADAIARGAEGWCGVKVVGIEGDEDRIGELAFRARTCQTNGLCRFSAKHTRALSFFIYLDGGSSSSSGRRDCARSERGRHRVKQ